MRLLKNKPSGKILTDEAMRQPADYFEKLVSEVNSRTEVITFLHNTKTVETAKQIVAQGFEFQSHIDYTTDVVSAKDPVTIKYFTIVRQAYGKFTIIIQISKKLVESYAQKLDGLDHHFSEVLTLKNPYESAEGDMIFCLPPNFVKGFISAETSEFFPNINFDPFLELPIFDENLKKLIR